MNEIQKEINKRFKSESGLSIDRQDERDLFAIMRAMFITYEYDPYDNVQKQIGILNQVVAEKALEQIRTNVSQFMTYVRDMDKPMTPLPTPENTSVYGTKIPDLRLT
jgi:hypothetical protein